MTDANFAARLSAQRKTTGITQQVLADRAAIHITALIEGALLRHHARQLNVS